MGTVCRIESLLPVVVWCVKFWSLGAKLISLFQMWTEKGIIVKRVVVRSVKTVRLRIMHC